MIELPTKVSAPVSQNPNRIIIYSQPKMGKTTFVSQLENNLIIDLERGSKFVTALKVEANSLADLGEIGQGIIKAGKPYKYVTIDTVSKLEDWCEWEATETYMNSIMGKTFNRNDKGQILPREKWESVLGLPNGAGYLWLRTSFKKWIDRMSTTTEHLILVAHIKDKSIEKKGKEITAKELDLTGKIKSITCANADAIGYMYRTEEGVLRLNFITSDEIACGARVEHLKGKDIEADWKLIFKD